MKRRQRNSLDIAETNQERTYEVRLGADSPNDFVSSESSNEQNWKERGIEAKWSAFPYGPVEQTQ